MKTLLDKLRAFHGLPPYDESSNIVVGDGYFYRSLIKEYGAGVVNAAEEQVKALRQRHQQLRQQFLSEFPPT